MPTRTIRVAMGQLASRVGDVDHNTELVLQAWRDSAERGADLVVFTELTLTGYLPEDLLLKPEFLDATEAALERLLQEGPTGTVAVVGTVARVGDVEVHEEEHWDVSIPALDLRNRAIVVADGRLVGAYDKWRLPNYGVFDEARYFVPDDDPLVVTVAGVPVGVTICEDLWTETGPLRQAANAGARVVANLNASPYHRGKRATREEWVRRHAVDDGNHVVYVNVVGGQDDVVFDGDSMLCGPDGTILARAAQFRPDLVVVDLDVEVVDEVPGAVLPGAGTHPVLEPHEDAPRLDELAEVWEALVLATRDYVRRNGFTEVIVALSGGIDSALTAAVAADALGGGHVIGLLLPSPYSSEHSLADARESAALLGLRAHEVPIGPAMQALDGMLEDLLAAEGTSRPDDVVVSVAEENIQSRLRGLVVMALSNDSGALVLTTGNKSEYAVGYATLYGDMNGGFAPLKDVPKTWVFDLARWRNTRSRAVPQHTIDKPPSAELKPGQTDQDSLPAYEVLDDIIERYVVAHEGIKQIVRAGHDHDLVREVVRMIDRSEFKRRQSAPGPKVTRRAFGRERRVPITHGWRG